MTGESDRGWSQQFQAILKQELIPEFCSLPARQCDEVGFVSKSAIVSEFDARNFIRAWRTGLIHQTEKPGLYRAPRSAASEQFFWTGAKHASARKFTLWLEPVLTVAALARLHFDFGWPAHLLGTQSRDWAFDLVTFDDNAQHEWVLGEVKKTRGEIDVLIKYMHEFGRDPSRTAPTQSRALNAHKKVVSLHKSAAPIFWALGPSGYGSVFRVHRYSNSLELCAVDESELHYCS